MPPHQHPRKPIHYVSKGLNYTPRRLEPPLTEAFIRVSRAAKERGITVRTLPGRLKALGYDEARARAVFEEHAREFWRAAINRGERVAPEPVFVKNMAGHLMREFTGETD